TCVLFLLRPPRIATLFPYTTLFRSVGDMRDVPGQGRIPTAERIPRHYTIDLTGQVAPTKRALVYLTIQNLTNNAYMVSRRPFGRSEEHTSELQSRENLVCRLLLEKK